MIFRVGTQFGKTFFNSEQCVIIPEQGIIISHGSTFQIHEDDMKDLLKFLGLDKPKKVIKKKVKK